MRKAVELVTAAKRLDSSLGKNEFVKFVLARSKGVSPGPELTGEGADIEFVSAGKDELEFFSHFSTSSAVNLTPFGVVVSTQSKTYSSICRTPCTVRFNTGSHTFYLAFSGRDPVVTNSVLINGPSTVVGDYEDNRSFRIIGAVAALTGTIVGGTIAFSKLYDCGRSTPQNCDSGPEGSVAVGGLVALAGLTTGVLLLSIGDKATVEVRTNYVGGERVSKQPAASSRRYQLDLAGAFQPETLVTFAF